MSLNDTRCHLVNTCHKIALDVTKKMNGSFNFQTSITSYKSCLCLLASNYNSTSLNTTLHINLSGILIHIIYSNCLQNWQCHSAFSYLQHRAWIFCTILSFFFCPEQISNSSDFPASDSCCPYGSRCRLKRRRVFLMLYVKRFCS